MITKMALLLLIICNVHILGRTVDMSSLRNLPADYNGYIYIYSHGLADTSEQMKPYQQAKIIYGPAITFDYPDSVKYKDTPNKKLIIIEQVEEELAELADLEESTYVSDIFNHSTIKRSISDWYYQLVRGRYKYSSLAQDYDIEHLKEVYDAVTQRFAHAKIILVGLSRGAATIDTMRYKYNDMKQVAAIITDSSFDVMNSVIVNMLKTTVLGLVLALKNAQKLAQKIFAKYRQDGISPIKAIDNADLTVPRLIVVSDEDNLVPSICGKRLYNKLRQMGHNKLHIFVSPTGKHGKILNVNRENYQYIVHKFYQHYGLPHDPLLAQKGENLFAASQPDLI